MNINQFSGDQLVQLNDYVTGLAEGREVYPPVWLMDEEVIGQAKALAVQMRGMAPPSEVAKTLKPIQDDVDKMVEKGLILE